MNCNQKFVIYSCLNSVFNVTVCQNVSRRSSVVTMTDGIRVTAPLAGSVLETLLGSVVWTELLRKSVVTTSAAIRWESIGSDASMGVWLFMKVANFTASALQAITCIQRIEWKYCTPRFIAVSNLSVFYTWRGGLSILYILTVTMSSYSYDSMHISLELRTYCNIQLMH